MEDVTFIFSEKENELCTIFGDDKQNENVFDFSSITKEAIEEEIQRLKQDLKIRGAAFIKDYPILSHFTAESQMELINKIEAELKGEREND